MKKNIALIFFICLGGQVFSQESVNSVEIGFGLNLNKSANTVVSVPNQQLRINFEFNHVLQKKKLHLIGNLIYDRMSYFANGIYEPRPLFTGVRPFNYSIYKADIISVGFGCGYKAFKIKRFELDLECSLGYSWSIDGQIYIYDKYSYSKNEFDMNAFNYNLNLSPKINLSKNYLLGIDFGITDYFNRKLELKGKEFNYKKPIYIQLKIGRKLASKKNDL